MTATRFDQLNIVSNDLDATVAFYRRLGVAFGEPARTSAGAPFHANARSGGAALEGDSADFARFWNEGWKNEANLTGRILVGLRVAERSDVDRLYGEITAAGHKGLQQPTDGFWGARYAIVEDPNGIAVGLMSEATGPHGPPPPEFT